MVSEPPVTGEPTSPTVSSLSSRPHNANNTHKILSSASRQSGSGLDFYEYDGPVSYSTEALLRRSASQEMQKPQLNGFNHEKEKEFPRLQANGHLDNADQMNPVLDDDPASYNLVAPSSRITRTLLPRDSNDCAFSKSHLQVIFGDPAFLFKFTSFLGLHRPQSVPILVHYLDSLKSLRAIHYANAICEGLDPVEGLDFTQNPVKLTINTFLEESSEGI